MKPQAYIATFGCQMNAQESAVMAALLERAGYGLSEKIDDASLVILETCAIRQKAEDKVYSMLGRLKKRRRQGEKDLKIAICGCLVTETAARDLVDRHGVNVVLGPRRIARIADAIAESEAAPVIDVGNVWALPPEDVSAPDIPGFSAFVTVMQGCSNGCTFCVVPSRRGAAQSREIDSIVADIARLEKKGYREVTLLGQNISYYGLDLPRNRQAGMSRPMGDGLCENGQQTGSSGRGRDPGGGTFPLPGSHRLIDLLERIEAETSIPRVRFATSHPAYVDKRFIEGFGRLRRVMPHLHLPVQSGSDSVLAAMRRGYTASRYIDIIDAMRDSRPEISVTTDIICGFDGEEECDHEATLALVERVQFDSAYVFAYSERPGTPAVESSLGKKVSQAERLRRCGDVLVAVEKSAASNRRRQQGEEVEALVERDGFGRTPQNISVSFDDGNAGNRGELRRIHVEKTSAFNLSGRILEVSPATDLLT